MYTILEREPLKLTEVRRKIDRAYFALKDFKVENPVWDDMPKEYKDKYEEAFELIDVCFMYDWRTDLY